MADLNSTNFSTVSDRDLFSAIEDFTRMADPLRRLAVIRVRSGNRIHYLVKKGCQPIYIRNEDEAIPAPAAELRALIENEHAHRTDTAMVPDPFGSISQDFRVTRLAPTEPDRSRGYRREAESYLKIVIQPTYKVIRELDYNYEDRFKSNVAKRFSDLVSPLLDDLAAESDVRNSESYIYKVLRRDPDMETLWALTDSGVVGFATTLATPVAGSPGLHWSLPDTAANIISSVQLANDILVADGYFGPVRLDLEIEPGGAVILRDAGLFGSLFRQDIYLRAWPVVIPQYHEKPATLRCNASITLGFNARSGACNSEISDVLNRILRNFGFAADLKTLRDSIVRR